MLGHGTARWSQLPVNEAKAIVDGFTNNNKVAAEGVKINGTKYLAVKYDNRSIYAKKVRGGTRSRAGGPGGCAIWAGLTGGRTRRRRGARAGDRALAASAPSRPARG